MSRYLVERIHSLPNVEVVVGSEVCALEGQGGKLDSVGWRDLGNGVETRRPMRFLFSFIGAEPKPDWLAGSGVRLDSRGFVATAGMLAADRLSLETSRRGIFAVGDVRSTSVKRVAAAVGDGAQVVASIHHYLATQRERATQEAAVPGSVGTL